MPDLYFLIEFPIFRDFDGNDIDALGSLCSEQAYKAGEGVVKEGEPADAMYVVKSGVLDVCRMVSGELRPINLLSAGEFFGEMALIDGSPRSADVLCKEDAVLIRLSGDAFRRLKKEQPATALKIADVLLKTLSFRVRRSTSRALDSESSAKTAASPAPKRKPAKRPRMKLGGSKKSPSPRARRAKKNREK